MYVSLVGRSNVGKSSLFNALLAHAGRSSSLLRSVVSENAGTTRDSKQSEIYIRGSRVTLVDTGGFEGVLANSGPSLTSAGGILNCPNTGSSFNKNNFPLTLIQNETHRAVQNSHLVLFVLDGRQGVTPLDLQLGRRLREWIAASRARPEVRLVVNKLEGPGSERYFADLAECLADCPALSFGDPLVVSARRGEGIERLARLIGSRLERREARRLEELSISGKLLEGEGHPDAERHLDRENHLDHQKPTDGDKPTDHHTQLDDIEDLHRHFEIEKSLRTCASVKAAYRPNDRWLRLLNSVCGVPFVDAEDDRFVVPSLLSPSERLASLYLSDAKRAAEAERSAGPVQEPGDHQHPYNLDQMNEQHPYNLDQMNEQKQEIDSNHKNNQYVKSKIKIHNENAINPINVLVLGSVDSDREALLSLLCGNHGRNQLSDLSPNWHSFYASWPVRARGSAAEQPVEIVVSAALNLGGSLGKMGLLQTLPLLRKCDLALFCVDNANALRGGANVVLSKREVAWLSRAVRLQKPVALAVHVQGGPKRCRLFLAKDYPLSFEFRSIPIVPMPRAGSSDSDSASKSADRLRNTIVSLLNRGKRMVDTATLNAWLGAFLARWPLPWKDGSRINLKFAAQVRASPPTFVLWSNVCASFPQHYLRQLKLALSEEFGFLGVPLKFVLRTTFRSRSGLRASRLKLRRKLFN